MRNFCCRCRQGEQPNPSLHIATIPASKRRCACTSTNEAHSQSNNQFFLCVSTRAHSSACPCPHSHFNHVDYLQSHFLSARWQKFARRTPNCDVVFEALYEISSKYTEKGKKKNELKPPQRRRRAKKRNDDNGFLISGRIIQMRHHTSHMRRDTYKCELQCRLYVDWRLGVAFRVEPKNKIIHFRIQLFYCK